MISRSTIELRGSDGRFSSALLRMDLSENDLEQTDRLWLPAQWQLEDSAQQAGISINGYMEHSHWRWSRKWQLRTNHTLYGGIEVHGEIQGIIILQLDRSCHHTSQNGMPLVYVDYIATAPWNNTHVLGLLGQSARYKSVGGILLSKAIVISQEYGWDGRLGLHSLRQTEDYYRSRFHMLDLGKDAAYYDLRYFEMTSEIASAFLTRED